jgi:hypothetical protein
MHDLPDLPALRYLKSLPHWVCWRLGERGGKPTKIPMSPHSALAASVTNPAHWGTYEQALACARKRKHSGIGFVLTETDGLTGVDLDHCRDPKTGVLEPWAQEILDLKETYAEISISGTGVHLFWLGKIAKTFKDNGVGVEVYRSARYLIVTGHHLRDTPKEIKEAPRTEALLRARVEASKPAAQPVAKTSPKSGHKSGNGAHSPFFRNVNDAALARLDRWVPLLDLHHDASYQPGTGAWRVSSKSLGRDLEEDISYAPTGIVDFGIHDMGDARGGRRTAIDQVIQWSGAADARQAAFWLCDRLGVAPDSLGWDDGSAAVAMGAEIAKSIIAHTTTLLVGEFPKHLLSVPGLVGEITEWITGTAIMPLPALSLGAALTIVGAATGRHMAGPTMSGTHLYVIALAPSGAGKDHPRAMIGEILKAADMTGHLGPAEFTSAPAVYQALSETPLIVCPMDEFGAFLKRINHRKASSFEKATGAALRGLWGYSFQIVIPPRAATRYIAPIHAPALSIYGLSTAEDFFGGLDGADITNGVINRLILIETSLRPSQQTPILDAKAVPASIAAGLKSIYQRVPLAMLTQSRTAPPFAKLDITREAEDVRTAFVRDLQVRGDRDRVLAPFLARTAENALRLATIVAIGRNSMTIDAHDMAWAKEMADWSSRKMAEGAALHIADSETQAIANAIRRAAGERKGHIKRRDLIRALDHRYRTPDLEGVIKALIEAEEFTVELAPTGSKGGRPSVTYVWAKFVEDETSDKT